MAKNHRSQTGDTIEQNIHATQAQKPADFNALDIVGYVGSDLRNKTQQEAFAGQESNNAHQQPITEQQPPSSEDGPEKKPLSLYELITAGLADEDIKKLNEIRDNIVNSEFITQCLFDAGAAIEIKLNRHVSVSVKMLSTEERDDLEGYLYAKDKYGFYTDDDTAEIKKIMAEADLDYAHAKDFFLRTFPRNVAQTRYIKAAVTLSVIKINGKSIGNNYKSRFDSVSKLPAVLTQQIQGILTLLERAVKLELSEDGLKN